MRTCTYKLHLSAMDCLAWFLSFCIQARSGKSRISRGEWKGTVHKFIEVIVCVPEAKKQRCFKRRELATVSDVLVKKRIKKIWLEKKKKKIWLECVQERVERGTKEAKWLHRHILSSPILKSLPSTRGKRKNLHWTQLYSEMSPCPWILTSLHPLHLKCNLQL